MRPEFAVIAVIITKREERAVLDADLSEFLSAKKVDEVCLIGLKSKPGCQPV